MRVISLILAGLLLVALRATGAPLPALEEGDLIFALTAGEDDDPIVEATARGHRLSTNHVGIVHHGEAGSIVVIEATPRHGVTATPVDSFLVREPRIAVARLVDTCGVHDMVNRALTYVGRPYDTLFMLDEQEIYCSELVWLSYVRPGGQRIFELIPMSFHGADGITLPYWRELYAAHHIRVPEGALGTNPAQLASSPALRIIFTGTASPSSEVISTP